MLWLDVSLEMAREADGWYIDEHMPERIDVGGYLQRAALRSARWSAGVLTLFEAQTPAALASEGYLRLVGRIMSSHGASAPAFPTWCAIHLR
jgi:hypothetical protein